MNILIIDRVGPGKYVPATTIRIVEPLSYLKDCGCDVNYAVVSEAGAHAKKMLTWADTVIFSKHHSDNAYLIAVRAKEMRKKIIYDIDDNIIAWPKDNPFRAASENYQHIIELADIITVENKVLIKELGHLHSDFVVIPNGIYVEKHNNINQARRKDEQKSYVFSAYISILNNFEKDFLHILYDFHSRNAIKMTFYGEHVDQIMSLPFVHHIPMSSYHNYLANIASSPHEYAIVPLRGAEDPESRRYTICKSPIKYITYGFAQIPAIYTDTLPYSAIISNGVNGILVDNCYDAWYDSMEKLLKDKVLQNKIRKNAHADVLENFHIKKSALRYLEQVLLMA